jgi:hypothetical protein
MNNAVCSVSPVIYLYRLGAIECLPKLFKRILMPSVVLEDLLQARFVGYDVPSPFDLPWVEYEDPQLTVPSAWLSLDLNSGEVASMSLALENRDCIVLLDEPMARHAANAVGVHCWGTLKLLLEAKQEGIIPRIAPYVDRFGKAGIWLTDDIRQRILRLAGESAPEVEDDWQ